MNEQLRQAEAFFHSKIPLTKAMGLQLISNDEAGLTLEAPLGPNHNHLGTAFGGSLNALATLAGYAMVWLELGVPKAHVVVRESSISFQCPVTRDFRATCIRPSDEELEEFRSRFERAGKARIVLEVVIEEDGQTCVEFEGTFVASQ